MSKHPKNREVPFMITIDNVSPQLAELSRTFIVTEIIDENTPPTCYNPVLPMWSET